MHIVFFWTVVLEKTLESPLDCKEIQPVHSKGDQPWVFFGRNDAKAETPVLWPPHAKSWFIGKDSDAGRDWGQEKGTTEDEMVGWHHQLDGRESEWTLGVGDGQGGLACCDSWGHKESDMTEQLNWTELMHLVEWSITGLRWIWGTIGMGKIDANCIQALDKLPGTTQWVDLAIAENQFPQNSQNLTGINPQTPLFSFPYHFYLLLPLLLSVPTWHQQ